MKYRLNKRRFIKRRAISRNLRHVKRRLSRVARGGRVRIRSSRARQRNGKERGPPGDRKLTYKHGRLQKIKKSFQKKVLACTSNINRWIANNSYLIRGTGSQASWFEGDILYDNTSVTPIYNTIDLSATSGDQRCTFRSFTTRISLTNQTTFDVNCRIYECIARHDIPAGNGPLTDLQQGFLEVGSNAQANPAFTVFDCPRFCQMYRVLKTNLVRFRAGETKNFTISDLGTHVLSYNRWFLNGTLKTNLLGGLSRFLLFQQWGAPACKHGDDTTLGYSVPELQYVEQVEVQYQFLDPISRYTNNPSPFAVLGTADAVVINNPTIASQAYI